MFVAGAQPGQGDHNARLRTGSHWVRAHGRLAQVLREQRHQIAVVHSRTRPNRSRLVLPQDFRGTRARLDPLEKERVG